MLLGCICTHTCVKIRVVSRGVVILFRAYVAHYIILVWAFRVSSTPPQSPTIRDRCSQNAFGCPMCSHQKKNTHMHARHGHKCFHCSQCICFCSSKHTNAVSKRPHFSIPSTPAKLNVVSLSVATSRNTTRSWESTPQKQCCECYWLN